MKYNEQRTEYTLKFILELSYRISRHSPPMKPFIRFSRKTDVFYNDKSNKDSRSLFWDFDYHLQKVLLMLLKSLAEPDEIAHLCIERWKRNLKLLEENSRKKLEKMFARGIKPPNFLSPRDEFILSRIKAKQKLLYIGCGTGKECLRLAEGGLSVIGIDTDYKLVKVAAEWSTYTGYSFYPICMDTTKLGFSIKSFDGSLIEFYGYQTSLADILNLQEELSYILRDSSTGFFVANRKAYASYWYKMGSVYPFNMTEWLMNQAQLDFHFSERDCFEENLLYGLYRRSHTVESLSLELSYAFNVVECMYEVYDPRYVICVVKPKKQVDPAVLASEHFRAYKVKTTLPQIDDKDIEKILSGIESICQILEEHEKRVVDYYCSVREVPIKNPLFMIKTNLTALIALLHDIFKITHCTK